MTQKPGTKIDDNIKDNLIVVCNGSIQARSFQGSEYGEITESMYFKIYNSFNKGQIVNFTYLYFFPRVLAFIFDLIHKIPEKNINDIKSFVFLLY